MYCRLLVLLVVVLAMVLCSHAQQSVSCGSTLSTEGGVYILGMFHLLLLFVVILFVCYTFMILFVLLSIEVNTYLVCSFL